MNIGIIGLGLIGGSFAKVYSKTGHTVWATDTDRSIIRYEMLNDNVSAELTDDLIQECDLILICIYPNETIEWMENKGSLIGDRPVVIDCCGTKRNIVERGRALAAKYGFTYVGGHPMAGTRFSGFKYARDDMFVGAPMVIVPPHADDPVLLAHVKKLLKPAGFESISYTNADDHDKVIAYTSQLAHVVSSAYVKSPTASIHKGFAADSYYDMTKVAWMNSEMWAQLFLDNADNLKQEIETLTDNLIRYRDAIADNNKERLVELLEEGRKRKEELDGE